MSEHIKTIKKFYSEIHYTDIKPGMIVVFDAPEKFTNLGIGMVTEINRDDRDASITVKIMEPSGHIRVRNLSFDLERGSIGPFKRGEAGFLHSTAWDQWKKENSNRK